MNSITHLARFHVSPERVYGVIGATDYLRQWWMREAPFGGEVGGAARSEWICRSVDARVRFDDRRPPASVRWKTIPVSSPITGWDATTIAFDLRAVEDGTFLALTHGGFEEADDDYDRTAIGWASCLLGLQRRLETGTEPARAPWRTDVFPNFSRPLTLTAER